MKSRAGLVNECLFFWSVMGYYHSPVFILDLLRIARPKCGVGDCWASDTGLDCHWDTRWGIPAPLVGYRHMDEDCHWSDRNRDEDWHWAVRHMGENFFVGTQWYIFTFIGTLNP